MILNSVVGVFLQTVEQIVEQRVIFFGINYYY